MKNKKILIVGCVAFALLVLAGGIFAFVQSEDDSTKDFENTNAKYTKCVEDANALQEKNENIVEKVNAEIEQCTMEILATKGYTDGFNCIEEYDNTENAVCNESLFVEIELQKLGYTDGIHCVEDYDNPICNETRYSAETDASNKHIDRYNAEIEASQECEKAREGKLKASGFDPTIIPALDCVKYLGEK